MMREQEQLPQGWALCNLPDFVHLEMGQSPPSTTYNHEGIGLPFFQGKAEFGELYPKIDKYCSEPKKIAKAGATLLTVRAPVGPTNLAKVDCCIGRGLAGIHPLGKIESKFILLLMKSIEHDISGKGTGSTFKAINKTFLEELVFLLPPLNEQRRIVAKIEALFSELDKGVESLKTAREQLNTYRQAVLKHAFEGKLTEQWRQDNKDKLEPAEKLLARIKAERDDINDGKPISESIALPNEWVWGPVSALLAAPLSNGRSVKDRPGGFPVLRLTALKGTTLDLDEHKEGDWDSQEAQKYLVTEGDFFLARGNGSKSLVGNGVLAKNVNFEVAFPDTMIRIRLNCDYVDPDYLALIWNSRVLREQIEAAARTTAGIYKINQRHVSSFLLPLPSLSEQAEIVQRLEPAMSAINRIADDIDFNLQKSEALRQSILKKAFSGQLVPQDPSDEPASVLLERIRAENAALAKTKAKPRAKKKTRKRKSAA